MYGPILSRLISTCHKAQLDTPVAGRRLGCRHRSFKYATTGTKDLLHMYHQGLIVFLEGIIASSHHTAASQIGHSSKHVMDDKSVSGATADIDMFDIGVFVLVVMQRVVAQESGATFGRILRIKHVVAMEYWERFFVQHVAAAK